jgi:hypothetical protein
LVGGPPGAELHTVVEELPSGDIGDMVPVLLPRLAVEIVPNAVAGAIAVDDNVAVLPTTGVETVLVTGGCTGMVAPGIVDVKEVVGVADIAGAAEIDGVVPIVPPVADMDVTDTSGVPGPICPDGVEQVTTVPGVVGLEASGSGANVVSGAPDWVAAENGLGPLSGEESIVPGVDGRPMAVVPMVETCARLALQPNSRTTTVNSKRSIAIASSAPI